MMSYEKTVFDAWLATAELPYDELIPLLHQMNGSGKIYEAITEHRERLPVRISDEARKRLSLEGTPERMEWMRKKLAEHEILSMTILDTEYPDPLRKIPDPPGILFYQGEPRLLKKEKRISMVGSRAASYSGLTASKQIAAELSRNGVTIISGLAYGIDTACHEGCLAGGSPTIGVMGCGLEQPYPSRNEPLKKEILRHGGMLISEYPPGVKAIGYHFPYRNRIISGLSDVVILMEAKIRSGSMTTIDHALRQGKEIYAYPGDPTSPLTEGNRSLLRDGARYFSTASDILTDMNWLDNTPLVRQNIGCSSGFVPENASEEAVYGALVKGTLGFDEIIQMTGLPPSVLMGTLTILQIKKAIDLLPGKKYQIRKDTTFEKEL